MGPSKVHRLHRSLSETAQAQGCRSIAEGSNRVRCSSAVGGDDGCRWCAVGEFSKNVAGATTDAFRAEIELRVSE